MSRGPPAGASVSECPLLLVPQAAHEGVGKGAFAHWQAQVLPAPLARLDQLPRAAVTIA